MGDLDKTKLIVICGPTATGKTALSVELALRFGGEVVCADSMQIYQGLDIGTAKVTKEEMRGVPHHLLDFLSPEQTFSVAEYVLLAQQTIAAIAARGALPILCGGTGLYISSLLNGLSFAGEKTDPSLRAQLKEQLEQHGPLEMHRRLAEVDPSYAASLHPNNTVRVLRGLELYLQSGTRMSQQLKASQASVSPYAPLIFYLSYADRQQLYSRIDLRVDQMVAHGLLKEASFVYENKGRFTTAERAIGYKEFFPYFEGEAQLNDCVEKLKQASRNYAKRQMTWFNRMENAILIDMGDGSPQEKIEKELEKYGKL